MKLLDKARLQKRQRQNQQPRQQQRDAADQQADAKVARFPRRPIPEEPFRAECRQRRGRERKHEQNHLRHAELIEAGRVVVEQFIRRVIFAERHCQDDQRQYRQRQNMLVADAAERDDDERRRNQAEIAGRLHEWGASPVLNRRHARLVVIRIQAAQPEQAGREIGQNFFRRQRPACREFVIHAFRAVRDFGKRQHREELERDQQQKHGNHDERIERQFQDRRERPLLPPDDERANHGVNADGDADVIRYLHMPLPEGEPKRGGSDEKRSERPLFQGAFQCPEHQRDWSNRAELVDVSGVNQRDQFAVQHQEQAAEKRAEARHAHLAQIEKHADARQHEICDHFVTDGDMRRKQQQRQQHERAENQVKPAAERRAAVHIRQPGLEARIGKEVFFDEDIPEILLRQNVGGVDALPGKQELREKQDADQQQPADSIKRTRKIGIFHVCQWVKNYIELKKGTNGILTD